MKNLRTIVAIAGLAVILAGGVSHAGDGNPWALKQHNGGIAGGTAALVPKNAAPLPSWQTPSNSVQRRVPQQNPAPFGSDYVPLPGEQGFAGRPRLPIYGYQQPYQPGYSYGGGFGNQFRFGMTMSPGFEFFGVPFGNGYPAQPYRGSPYAGGVYPYGSTPYGGAPYGNMPFGGAMPFGGFNPWSMGFPMF